MGYYAKFDRPDTGKEVRMVGMNEFHKPALFAGHEFAAFRGGEDPAEVSFLAHESARALMARVREAEQPEIVDRVVTFADENGTDVLAELWAASSAHSLPGALWRLYLIRDMIVSNAEHTSILYGRGVDISVTPDPLVAGAPVPAGPDEMRALADLILRGAFEGDFADALHRAAAFCRVLAHGCTSMADDAELITPERATALTTQALRLSKTAAEFAVCARLDRDGSLD